MNDQFIFSSSVVDLAEEQDYLSLRNRVCFFNDKNLNNVQIDYDESTLEKCKSLVNMPVVSKYIRRNGKDDLGGHEVKVVDGKIKFGTATIGTVTGVEIVNEDVETTSGEIKNLPVLYADERIWTRNENATNAIRRLYTEGSLYSSWEIKTSEYTFKDSVKHLVDYSFLSNCLLGTNSYPAYGKGGAVVTDISETSEQYEYLAAESILSEALILDFESGSASDTFDSKGKEADEIVVEEDKILESEEQMEEAVETVEDEETAEAQIEDREIVEPEVSEDSEQTSESEDVSESESDGETEEESENASEENDNSEKTEETDNSSMKTDIDIQRMLEKAVNNLYEKDEEEWLCVSMVFPEEHVVLCRNWKMPQLSFVKYDYSIDGEDVTLSNRELVELVVSPLQINSEIDKKNSAIADANNRIVELENQNAELMKAKEELDQIKAKEAEAQKAEAVSKLRDYVLKSNCFTSEEFASEEVQNAINSLNEVWLKGKIADYYMASFNNKKEANVEISEKKSTSVVSITLGSEDSDVTASDVMREFFKDN